MKKKHSSIADKKRTFKTNWESYAGMELHAPLMQPIINGVKQPVIIRQSQPPEIIPIFIPFIFAT